MSTADAGPKPRLEFGSLTTCPKCRRRKLEPGARHCPDCVAISRLVGFYGDTLRAMHKRWVQDKPTDFEEGTLAGDDRYESFSSRDELMRAYERWQG